MSRPLSFGAPVSRRAVGGMTVVAVVSFLLSLVLLAFGEDLTRPPTPHSNTFSYSALGHRALVELLGELGLGVRSRQLRAGIGTGPRVPLVVAEVSPRFVRHDRTRRLAALAAEARRRSAPLVVVLAKWRGVPREDRPGWLDSLERLRHAQVEAPLEAFGLEELLNLELASGQGRRHACHLSDGGSVELEIEAPRLLRSAAGWESVVTCPEGLLVARRSTAGGPEVVLVTDPDLLNNQGLGRGDNGVAAYHLFVEHLEARGVVFDETVHGFVRSSGILAEALGFPLILASLQALLLCGMVAWAGVGRFGTPRRRERTARFGKETLIQTTATLLVVGGHWRESLRRYWLQAVRRVARHLSLSPELSEEETMAALVRMSRRRGTALDPARIRAHIETLPDSRDGESGALALARQLWRWQVEMTHGDRTGS